MFKISFTDAKRSWLFKAKDISSTTAERIKNILYERGNITKGLTWKLGNPISSNHFEYHFRIFYQLVKPHTMTFEGKLFRLSTVTVELVLCSMKIGM